MSFWKIFSLGQLLRSTDPEDIATIYTYDALGRLTRRDHPDAGATEYAYDPAGNIIRQTTPLGEINFDYTYYRLTHKRYSHMDGNNVAYTYHLGGRIESITDGTGHRKLGYDALGNLVHEDRYIAIPNSDNVLAFHTEYTYDSWGRMRTLLYPDGEQVTYTYRWGGDLFSVHGTKGADSCRYIDSIAYNALGQRTLVRYENNVETRYIYDSLTRRLARMYDTSHLYRLLQDNRYTYDPVGNITAIDDNGLNRRWQTYEYDPTNRLIQSEGNMDGLGLEYRSDYKYSAAGKITRKNVQSTRFNNHGQFSMDYSNEYHYPTAGNPFAIEKVSDMNTGEITHFQWDGNGNLVHAGNNRNNERRLRWTEDNRLQAFWEHSEAGDIAAWYNYTADGTRNFKFTSPKLLMSQNASYIRLAPPLVDPTLYASPLLTLSKHGYTKHYFEEGRRICSKIGGGFDAGLGQDIERPVGVISGSLYILHEQQRMSVQKTFTHDMDMEAGMEGVHDLSKVVMNHELGRDDPEPAFFYHSDHLGSAAYITDEYGQWTQMLNYLPYGEDWVERNRFNPADTTRLGIYRFNGKEKDHESGFHYYGARYYWSELLTGWLSVDPLVDKYPSVSPYAYCEWNPVINIDPDGRRKWPILKEYNGANRTIVSGMYRNSTGTIHGGVDIVHRPVSGPPNLEGGTIYATHDGIVEISGRSQTAGNWIVIRNGNIRTKYMHMQDVSHYNAGDYVLENTPIGIVGNTGRSEGPHVHYQLEQLNPETTKWERINPVEGDIPKVTPSMEVDLKDPQLMINARDGISHKINLNEVQITETKEK